MCTLYVVFVQHLGSDSAVMMDSLEFIDEACNGFVPGLAESSRLFYHLFNDYEGRFICPLLLKVCLLNKKIYCANNFSRNNILVQET